MRYWLIGTFQLFGRFPVYTGLCASAFLSEWCSSPRALKMRTMKVCQICFSVFRCSRISNVVFPVVWLGSGLANLMEVLTVKKVMLWHSLSVSLHEIRRLFYKNKQSYVRLRRINCSRCFHNLLASSREDLFYCMRTTRRRSDCAFLSGSLLFAIWKA